MTEVVIIAHNEEAHIARMLETIPTHWNIHYVADRCTDGTHDTLRKIQNATGRPHILTHNDFGNTARRTSSNRNLGLSYCAVDSDVLFLDGDRYPVRGTLAAMVKDADTDITLLPVEKDFRTPEQFRMAYGRVNNCFYSCGLFVRRAAIRKVQERQRGQFFNEELESEWGIEDTALGDLCYDLGLTAKLTDKVALRGDFGDREVERWETIKKRLDYRNTLKNVIWG